MSEELKPCPFCGSAVKMARHKGSDETGERWDYFAVECRGKDHNVICDAGDTAAEVAAAWNRRSIPTPEGQGGGEDARELAQRVIDTWGDGNPPIVVLARALLSSPRVEREWCLNCGTVTRDHRCHCTEIGQEPHFVNYADELAQQMNAAASSPRVEEVRREAINEAADTIESLCSPDTPAANAVLCRIANALRAALSLQVG